MRANLNIQDHILLWNAAAVKIMDVRHASMTLGEEMRSYRFPASGFLYATAGGARVSMDGVEHKVDRFYVLHGGKGACLDITPMDETFDYYLILYKATPSLPCDREILRLMDRQDPFRLQYGFIPLYPASLFTMADRMLQEWRRSGRLEKFHVKTLFFQFVHAVLRQLEHEEIGLANPDLTAQVVRYMHDHYSEPVTRESIAQIFHYSVPYLSKQFRRDTGNSLIDYLIRIRVDKAKELLRRTDITIQEAAASVGYGDVSYFTRIFKKVAGLNPKQFKDRSREEKRGFNRPIAWLGSSIASPKPRNYNENYYHHENEGNLTMNRNGASVGVTLLLCLALLLSACSNSSNANSANHSTNNGSSAATAQTETTSGSETVIYKAVNGDIEIPKNPRRIVAVAGAYVGYLLTLGIEPVGAGGEAFQNDYLQGKLDGVEDIGEDVPLEKIVELKPDLIVIWNDQEAIANLSKIAPTVAIEYGTPMREQLLEFGKMTGREAQAEAWIAAWDKQIAEYKPSVEAAVGDKTVSIFDESSAKEFYAYGAFGRGGDIIYGEFHLKAPSIIQKEAIDSGKGWAQLSLELLPEYAGDYIFISGWTGNENPEVVFEGPVWDSLPAVQNKRVFRNDGRGFVYSDPVSLEAQLKFVVDSLTGA